jgi:hypothetical protein
MHWSKLIVLGAVICVAGGELLGCDPTPPIDENFDSSLGADFKAPPEDAGADAATAAVEADTP